MFMNNFTFPPHITFANFSDTGAQSSFVIKSQNHYSSIVKDPSLTWTSLDRLCRLTKLPKGILTAEDAREAVKHNSLFLIMEEDMQVDGVPATVSQLPILKMLSTVLFLLCTPFRSMLFWKG